MVLESPTLVVLGNISIHAKVPQEGTDQDFMLSVKTMGRKTQKLWELWRKGWRWVLLHSYSTSC